MSRYMKRGPRLQATAPSNSNLHRFPSCSRHRLHGITKHVAPAPNGFDVVLAVGRGRQLLAKLAHEDVDDLDFRLVHAAVEVVLEHLLGEGSALAQGEELQHAVLLAGQMNATAASFHRLGVQVDADLAGLDDRLGVALAATNDSMHAGHELMLVERLGHVVVRAAAEGLHLRVDVGTTRHEHDRRIDLADPQLTQDVQTAHVRQDDLQDDDVVVEDLAEINAFFTKLGGIDVEALGLHHQLHGLDRGRIRFDE